MAGYDVTSEAKTIWTHTVDLNLEAGQRPLLDAGAGIGLLENLPVLVALHAYAQQRRDVTAPLITTGGNPLLWLAATMHEQPSQLPTSPGLTVLYGGPDLATQLAVIATLAPPRPVDLWRNQLPTQLASWFAPTTQGGAVRWEAFPWAQAEVAQQPVLTTVEPSSGERWLSWLGLGLALVLIILALLA
jgi:hypothetical protein